MTRYIIVDTRTGNTVGQSYADRNRALRRADALDNAYGAYRYSVRPIETPEKTQP